MPIFNNPIIDFFLNPWFIFSLIFWLIVLLLVYLLRKKKGATYLFFPLLVMFKTKRLNKFIRKISRKRPKFWRIFWTIGIFVSFSFTIFAFYYLFTNFVNLIVDPKIEQAIVPLIPGVTIDLPLLFYLILPLLFIVTTHEFAHGIAASSDGLDIKSTGVLGAGLFFVIGFGAFVEIDEREANSNKVSRYTRLRIAAAGTYINGITAGIAFILILCFPLMMSPSYRQTSQVNIVLKGEEGGYNYGNLSSGDVIIALKEKGTTNENYEYIDEFKGVSLSSILSTKAVGDNMTLMIYSPSSELFQEKNVTLGPRYDIGIRWQYTTNGTGLIITDILSENEGGINFNTSLEEGMIVEKINGIPINVSQGDTLENLYTSSFEADHILTNITFTTSSDNVSLDVGIDGVIIGIYSFSYYMFKNDIAKFFTNFFPEFLIRELGWLFLIAFSITLFNMLPLPVFDGDRLAKELINWGIGEEYRSVKKKKDKFVFKSDEKNYELSEYRVEKINYVKFMIDDQSKYIDPSQVTLSEEKYELIDKVGDGFKDTALLKLPEETKLKEGSKIEISYDYWHDEKRKVKKIILNSLRVITLIIFAGNFILSFVKFGGLIFWI
jgi:membrane-associated protease RseP (regulator of RpoE activity)